MDVSQRIAALDWPALERDLWDHGCARTGAVLTAEECTGLVALYADPTRFRSRVEMERFRFGVGDYQYFARPLPPIVEDARTALYPPLAGVANRWMEALGAPDRFPEAHSEFLKICHDRGQTKATPLLLHYEASGYNALHQDLYGEVAFPLQVVCFLSRPGVDHTGGEFLLVEQRPRAQSVGQAIRGEQGEMLIFTTRYRPVKGGKGYYRANVRHGTSRVLSGSRYTLGIIFHDAT